MCDPPAVEVQPLRPWLPWIALGLVLGALGPELPGAAWWWWAAALPLAVLALLVPGPAWPQARRWALLLASAGLGHALAPPALDPLVPPRVVEASGVVHRTYPGRYSQRFLLTEVRLRRGVLPAGSATTIFCTDAPLVPGVRPGDRVRVGGLWSVEEAHGRVRSALSLSLLTVEREREHGPHAAAWRAVERLGPQAGLAGALLLGRGAPEERLAFKQAGLLHVLAVSGLHLGLAIGAIYLLLGWSGVPWRERQLLAIVAAFAYLWFTGGSLPTQRAALMAAAFFGYRLLGRRTHRLAALSTAIIVLVLWDPAQVRGISFQLSVAAVLGIATLGMDLVAWRQRRWPLRPWPLDRAAWRGALWLGRGAADGLAIGVAATLAVMPLLGWHFGEAQPYAPLASVLVALPLSLGLVAGLGWIGCSSLWLDGPWSGLGQLTAWALEVLTACAEAVAGLPGSLLAVGAPAAWQIVLWPALFLAVRDGWDLTLRAAAVGLMIGWWWG